MILHEDFVDWCKKYSSRTAIVDKTTGKTIGYDKALIGALILAKKLKKYNDGTIGVMIPTSAGAMLAVVGILMAGKVPAMINYSTGAANNCEYAQDKCGFKTIITSRALCEKIKCRLVAGMVFIEDIMESVTTKDKLLAAVRSKMPAGMIKRSFHKADPGNTAAILFTSGSEKNPKAVQLSHKNISSNCKALLEAYQVDDSHTILAELPLFHAFGFTIDFWLPLSTGWKMIAYANPLDYKKIPRFIREEQITIMAGTPIFFAGYLKEAKPGDFDSLQLVIPSADKTPEWLRKEYMEQHGIELLEAYGATECAPAVSINPPGGNKAGSIGKAIPGVRVKITDVETGEEVGTGQEGKILVKGDNIMKGYFDDFEETSLRIKNGWYDTGDMGMLDEDNYLWHRGRLKRFVKIGGEMVSLVKTESIIDEVLPEGISCCVVEIPDSLKGARIVAAVNKPVEEKKIRKKLGELLPAIAIPKLFMVIEEFPKMGSGKVDFRTITNMARKAYTN